MKKIAGLLITLGLMGMLMTGCGDSSQDQDKTENAADTESDTEVTEEPTQEPEGEEEEPEPDTEEEQEPDEEVPLLSLPDGQDLKADYTSVEGMLLDPGAQIAFVVKDTKSEYWKELRSGVEQAISDLNEVLGYTGSDKVFVTFEGPKDELGVDEQVNILDAVITENPAAICLAAVDRNSCVAQLEAADENEIPVIILDSGVDDTNLYDITCMMDNYAAGKEAAIRLCEAIGDEGQIAALGFSELSQSCAERLQGFEDEVTENHPDVEIVDISYESAKADSPSGTDLMEAVLTLYPDLKGYLTTDEESGAEALSVLANHTNKNVQLVSFGGGTTQVNAVKDGTMLGLIGQNPYTMGYVSVVAAARAIRYLDMDEKIDTGFCWLDADTIELEENAGYLY